MNCKLILHDLRCGLLRKKYLLIPIFFFIPMMAARAYCRSGFHGGFTADFLLCSFRGMLPVLGGDLLGTTVSTTEWMSVVGGCLFLNLDYCLYDLKTSGHQLMIRSGKRVGWYFSKCLWNVCSCLLYFLIMVLMGLLFSAMCGASWNSLHAGEVTSLMYFGVSPIETLKTWEQLTIGLLFPFLTVLSLSLLEMTLCLFVRPVYSFLAVISLMAVSVQIASPLVIGNGAMGIRNAIFWFDPLYRWQTFLSCLALIGGSLLAGAVRIKRMDVLGLKE